MTPLEWAMSIKRDLVAAQRGGGPPALHAVAQFLHESFDPATRGLTELATVHHNYAGLTWYEEGEEPNWQRKYGATPVTMRTREVINGQDEWLDRQFASYPSFSRFLRAYLRLLTNPDWRYARYLAYAHDPLLYCNLIVRAGWATDGAAVYTNGVATFMADLWLDYADTLPGREGYRVVPIYGWGGAQIGEGLLKDGTTMLLVPIRQYVSPLGVKVHYDEDKRAVYLTL